MNSSTVKCENCGALCNAKDGYCKSCWKKLRVETEQDDFIIDGIGQSEWEDFIDKNKNRYIEVYKKNDKKKIFLHINWSAFFFGLNWVLYRKMYKVAVIGFVIASLISFLLNTIFLLPHIDEIKSLNKDIAAYQAYIENGGKNILLDEEGVPYSPEVVQKSALSERKLEKIETGSQLKSALITTPISLAFWGLFADAIYKMHIKKNIKNKNGGTSIPSLIGGRLLLGAIEILALNPLVAFISGILLK